METIIERPLDWEQELENILLEARARELFERLGIPLIGGAAAGSWTFTNGGRTRLLNGTFDIDTDTFKIALFQSTSNIGAASTTYAGLTNEVASANGYTTGGASTRSP